MKLKKKADEEVKKREDEKKGRNALTMWGAKTLGKEDGDKKGGAPPISSEEIEKKYKNNINIIKLLEKKKR